MVVKPDELYDGVRARVILSRRDNEEGTAPEWRPPEIVTLYVKRRDSGEIITLAILDFAWAEYRQANYSPKFDEWLNEEYRMRILEIVR